MYGEWASGVVDMRVFPMVTWESIPKCACSGGACARTYQKVLKMIEMGLLP